MRFSALLPFAFAATAFAQQQPAFTEPPVYVTAIDIVAEVKDSSGKVPAGLTPADLVLLEDGVERKIIGIEYLAQRTGAAPASTAGATAPPPATIDLEPGTWQLVVYFENQLSTPSSRKRVAEALIAQAERLAGLGSVDVIYASPTPTPILRDSRDAEAIKAALRQVISQPAAPGLLEHRRRFYTIQQQGGLPVKNVVPYVDDEVLMVGRFRTNLIKWLSNYGRRVPRTLLVVSDGFEVDPAEFYANNLKPADQALFRSHVQHAALAESTERTAQALAAGGWTTVTVPGDAEAGFMTDDASTSGILRARTFGRSDRLPGVNAPNVTAGPRGLLTRGLEPLQVIAERTGGSMVPNPGRLTDAISGLGSRVKVTYQVPRAPDGRPRKVELKARSANLKIRTARWAAASTPEEMAQARAVGLLREASGRGDLRVESSVVWDDDGPSRRRGTLYVVGVVDPVGRALPSNSVPSYRVTMAVEIPPRNTFVVTREVMDQYLSKGTFKYRAPVEVPANASQVVVTVEEMLTGLWGSSRFSLNRPASAAAR